MEVKSVIIHVDLANFLSYQVLIVKGRNIQTLQLSL